MKNEQELKNVFGENIKNRRKRMGLTQEQLAEKAGVSKNTISDIETGEKFVYADTLVLLAQALETEVYELLKPKDIFPDKAADILTKYGEEVREAVEKIGERYLENVK